MDIVRNFERRLERVVEGLAGKVFRGALHPVELGSRLVREADLALKNEAAGPTAPNAYVLHVHPSELGDGSLPDVLSTELAAYVEANAIERGWRLQGPVVVHIELDSSASIGSVRCQTDFTKGPLPVWAFLAGSSEEISLRHNRTSIGRGLDNDIVLDYPEVSRTHAILWRESNSIWLADTDSSNGTAVDGARLETPSSVRHGSVIAFGSVAFTFRRA